MSKVEVGHYLIYTEGCSPKVKLFKSEESLNEFIANFALSMYDNPDNWIDFAFYGNITKRSKEFKLDDTNNN